MTPSDREREAAKKLCEELGLHGSKMTCLCSETALLLTKFASEERARVWEEAASMVRPIVDLFGEPGRVPGRLLADYIDRAAAERRGE